ncbi:MAG: HU family DNA-binding protein [Legionellales bacterium]|nr:HU family DNA-binding protein [Legionellales bacterium]
MNKTDLVKYIAEKAEVTQVVANKALSAVVEAVYESLKKGEPVTLIGFGTWGVADRQEREGRNPQTGEKIKIKARKAVKFTAGKDLKDAVNS